MHQQAAKSLSGDLHTCHCSTAHPAGRCYFVVVQEMHQSKTQSGYTPPGNGMPLGIPCSSFHPSAHSPCAGQRSPSMVAFIAVQRCWTAASIGHHTQDKKTPKRDSQAMKMQASAGKCGGQGSTADKLSLHQLVLEAVGLRHMPQLPLLTWLPSQHLTGGSEPCLSDH